MKSGHEHAHKPVGKRPKVQLLGMKQKVLGFQVLGFSMSAGKNWPQKWRRNERPSISGRCAVANVVGVQVVDGANHLLHDLISVAGWDASTQGFRG